MIEKLKASRGGEWGGFLCILIMLQSFLTYSSMHVQLNCREIDGARCFIQEKFIPVIVYRAIMIAIKT